MDFFNQMEVLSIKISELLDHVHSEASTRSALVEPFIKILGYDPSNPLKVYALPTSLESQTIEYFQL